MKKVYIISGVILLGFIGLFIFSNSTFRINEINADRFRVANTFQELEKSSDLIVEATVLSEKETVLDKLEDDTIVFGYTITKLRIDEVFSGDVKNDDIIVITEEYFTVGKDIFTQGNYIPAKENSKYIFYLKKYDDSTRFKNMYYPIDLEKGRYSLQNNISDIDSIDTLTNKEMEIGKREDKEYRQWYKQTISKYKRKNR